MKKNNLFICCVILMALVVPLLAGCNGGEGVVQQTIAIVRRGDLEARATVDGYIETPAAVSLYFDTTMFTPPYSGKIRDIYVEKGDTVRAGMVLAKLDDTTQKLAVEAAQYTLELALNNMVQTVCCGIKVSPSHYTEAVPIKRFEFARDEMEKAQSLLLDGKYAESAEQISLAKLDLEGARDFLSNSTYRDIKANLMDINQSVTADLYLGDVITALTGEIDKISALQKQYGAGEYDAARESIQYILMEMGDNWSLINGLSHLPGGITVPDSCTTYTVLNEIDISLEKLEEMSKAKDIDSIKYAETLNVIKHDLELSKKIIGENRETYWLGLNLKMMRDTNINIQNALVNLDRAKQSLLKTELIAPFDGRVEDVNLRPGDLITQRYSPTGVPIDSWVIRLADNSYVKMSGIVDEIDAVKIKAGQKAVILVDALPGKKFDGTVKFVSSYAQQQSAGIQYYGTLQPLTPTYKIEIDIDREQAAGLYGNLSASAEILTDKRANVLLVPNGAVSEQDHDYMVRVLLDEKTGIFEQRPVKIGLQSRSLTEILSGLQEGEKVLVEKVSTPTRQLHIGG